MKGEHVTQIKNDIIANPFLSSDGFVLYVQLTFLYQLNGNIYITPKRLKEYMDWKDTRTLRKYLVELYRKDLLEEDYKTLPRGTPLQLTPRNLVRKGDKNFTQLPTEVLYWVKTIGKIGIRLLYFYEKFINRHVICPENAFAFPGYTTIEKRLGIDDDTITKYNSILVKNKLLRIENHETENYEDGTFKKYCNHYYVNIPNIRKIKNKP